MKSLRRSRRGDAIRDGVQMMKRPRISLRLHPGYKRAP